MSVSNKNVPHASAPAQENFVHRVSALPIVNDAHTLIQSNEYASFVYAKVEQISASLLNLTQPLQDRLPISTANVYANNALDFVEKRVPGVKTVNSEEVVNQATSIAKAYTDQLHSRLVNPVTEQLQLRLQQGSETIHAIQERLGGVAAALPRDKASATEVVNSLFRELDSLSVYIADQRKNLPANVQSTLQPVLDRLQESFLHIKEVASKPDATVTAKTSDILSYSQQQLSPLLNDAVGVVKSVIAVASTKATETKAAGQDLSATAEKKTVETAQVVEKEVKEVGQKAKKAKVNGAAH